MNNTNKTLPLILGIVVVVIFVIGFLFLFNVLTGMKKGSVRIKDTTFSVELPKTSLERERGLSGRKSLAENKGMLFIFDTSDYHRFWMKDMKLPLDILFLQGNKIITMYENVPSPASSEENANPPVYTSTEPVNQVLEIPAGTSKKLGIKQGDLVEISL